MRKFFCCCYCCCFLEDICFAYDFRSCLSFSFVHFTLVSWVIQSVSIMQGCFLAWCSQQNKCLCLWYVLWSKVCFLWGAIQMFSCNQDSIKQFLTQRMCRLIAKAERCLDRMCVWKHNHVHGFASVYVTDFTCQGRQSQIVLPNLWPLKWGMWLSMFLCIFNVKLNINVELALMFAYVKINENYVIKVCVLMLGWTHRSTTFFSLFFMWWHWH